MGKNILEDYLINNTQASNNNIILNADKTNNYTKFNNPLANSSISSGKSNTQSKNNPLTSKLNSLQDELDLKTPQAVKLGTKNGGISHDEFVKLQKQTFTAPENTSGTLTENDNRSWLKKGWDNLWANGGLGNRLKNQKDSDLEILKYNLENETNKDTFFGRFKANYSLGNLAEEKNLAWNEYINDPTEENKRYAQAVDGLYNDYYQNNKDVVESENGGIISKSFANYAPQALRQGKQQVIGTALGGRTGATVATGAYSYNNMRGATFGKLVANGVDESVAKNAATDEAKLSSAVEMTETGVSLTLGPIAGIFGGGTEEAARQAAKPLIAKLASALGKYGLNVGSEFSEEYLQEIISSANEKRIADGKGNGGTQELMDYIVDEIDTVYGQNKNRILNGEPLGDEAKRALEAGIEGGKVAAIMGLGETGISHISQNGVPNVINQQPTPTVQEAVAQQTAQAREAAATSTQQTSELDTIINNSKKQDNKPASKATSFSKAATQILKNENALRQYENEFGALGDISEEAKAKKIANDLYNRARSNEVTAENVAEQNARTVREAASEMTPDQNYVRGLVMDKSRSSAEEIVDNPLYRRMYMDLASQRGLKSAELSGSRKNKIDAIMRDKNNFIAGETEISFEAKPTNVFTPISDETVATENIAQNSAENIQNNSEQFTQVNEQNVTETVKPQENQGTASVDQPIVQNTQNDVSETPLEPGTIPERQEVPKTRTRERGYSQTTRDNSYIYPELREKYNKDMYQQKSNKETFNQALDVIETGIEEAARHIEKILADAKNGMKVPDYAVPLSTMLQNELYEKGQTERATNIRADMAVELTAAGRLAQAARILHNATVEDKVAVVQKTIEKVGKQFGTEYSVPKDYLDAYARAETDAARDAALDTIINYMAENTPSTLADKWTALRYTNMLGNLKTQARNVIGNLVNTAAYMAKTKVKAANEGIVSLINPDVQRSAVIRPVITSSEFRQALAECKGDLLTEAMGEGKYESGSYSGIAKKVNENRTIFKAGDNALTRATDTVGKQGIAYKYLEGKRKVTGKAMDVGDEIFVRYNYAYAIANALKANGITFEEYQQGLKNGDATAQAIRENGIKQAQEVTFRDSNILSDAVTNFDKNWNKGGLKVAKVIGQGIQPFRKTPANVFARIEEFSPAGLFNAIVDTVNAKKGKDSMTINTVIDDISKVEVGTGIVLLGAVLASKGLAHGKEDDEELAAHNKQMGIQDYSLTIGDRNITLDWLSPSSVPLFMGVALEKAWEDGQFTGDEFMQILGSLNDPMLEMSMMSSINDALKDISSFDGDPEALPQFIVNEALSYLMQGLSSTLLGQVEQLTEENRQTYYTDRNSLLPTSVQKQIAKWSMKVPGYDYQTSDYIDAWGNKVSNGDISERAFNSLANPSYVTQLSERTTEVDKKLQDIYKAVGKDYEGQILPKTASRSTTIDGEKLTTEEYDKYATASGKKSFELISQYLDSDLFETSTDEQRAKVISNLYAISKEYAKNEIQKSRGSKQENEYYPLLEDGTKKGKDNVLVSSENLSDYVAYKTTANDAINNKDYALIDNLVDVYKNSNSNLKSAIDGRIDGMKQYIKAANNGVKAESWAKAQEKLDEIQWAEDTESDGSRLKYKAIISANIPEADKDKLINMDDYVSKNWKMADKVLSSKGFNKQQIYDFFSNADWTYSKKTEEYEANGQLGAYEAYVALQRLIPNDKNLRKEIFDSFVEATGEPGRYDGWSRNTGKNKWKKYDYNYCEWVINTYGDSSYGSWNNSKHSRYNALTDILPKPGSTPN